jgi:hypothetical protein
MDQNIHKNKIDEETFCHYSLNNTALQVCTSICIGLGVRSSVEMTCSIQEDMYKLYTNTKHSI